MKRSFAAAFGFAVILAWGACDQAPPMAPSDQAFAVESGSPIPTVEPVTDTQTVSPRAKIKDFSTVTSTIDVAKDLDLTSVQVKLNIRHSQASDLVISLTSPSGKTVVLSNRDGAFNLKGTVDLSAAFRGDPGYGRWTLTVEDQAKKHTGALNSWTLSLVGVGTPPPA